MALSSWDLGMWAVFILCGLAASYAGSMLYEKLYKVKV